MSRPTLQVADILRVSCSSFVKRHGSHLAPQHRKVMDAIVGCRTAALGGHRDRCPGCGHQAISYNSCRNRHCPKGQSNARDRWLFRALGRTVAVPYFHLVFTLPHELSALVQQNKKLLYDLLFRASAATLLEVARDPKHLGADIGLLSVLDTWGQNLQHPPHVHWVVPGGGLALDGSRWVSASSRFLLPVRVLSRVLRGKFTAERKQLLLQGKLQFHNSLQELASPERFQRFFRQLFTKEWVVYAKPPFGGAEHVLNYLARYTYRVAISNHRLVSFKNDQVCFRWKDYAQASKQKVMTVSADQFLRRLLIHVLPKLCSRTRRIPALTPIETASEPARFSYRTDPCHDRLATSHAFQTSQRSGKNAVRSGMAHSNPIATHPHPPPQRLPSNDPIKTAPTDYQATPGSRTGQP